MSYGITSPAADALRAQYWMMRNAEWETDAGGGALVTDLIDVEEVKRQRMLP